MLFFLKERDDVTTRHRTSASPPVPVTVTPGAERERDQTGPGGVFEAD